MLYKLTVSYNHSLPGFDKTYIFHNIDDLFRKYNTLDRVIQHSGVIQYEHIDYLGSWRRLSFSDIEVNEFSKFFLVNNYFSLDKLQKQLLVKFVDSQIDSTGLSINKLPTELICELIKNSNQTLDKKIAKYCIEKHIKHALCFLLAKYSDKLHNCDFWLNVLYNNNNAHRRFDLNEYKRSVTNQLTQDNCVYGYKAFFKHYDGTLNCRDYTFDMENTNMIDQVYPCVSGFHFCKKKVNVPNYYQHIYEDPNIVVYKVAAWGIVIDDKDKTVCSHLKILNKVRKPPQR